MADNVHVTSILIFRQIIMKGSKPYWKSWRNDSKNYEQKGEETNKKFQDLQPGTNYKFWVISITDCGESNKSVSTSVNTDIDGRCYSSMRGIEWFSYEWNTLKRIVYKACNTRPIQFTPFPTFFWYLRMAHDVEGITPRKLTGYTECVFINYLINIIYSSSTAKRKTRQATRRQR